jgi:ATP-dependent Clp protease ATP-binding subunit ClpA
VELIISPGVEDVLAAEGYDPEFGARPLKRVIQHRLENPIAVAVLEHRPKKVTVSVKDGRIVLSP